MDAAAGDKIAQRAPPRGARGAVPAHARFRHAVHERLARALGRPFHRRRRPRAHVRRAAEWLARRHARGALGAALEFHAVGGRDAVLRQARRLARGPRLDATAPQPRRADGVEDVLVAREADASSASRWERIASLLLPRASKKPWTEYATYFLALDAARQWMRFHEPLSVCAHGSHAEAPSRRCDRPSFAWGASASRAVRGCLKVRADCVSELEMELRTDAVPFVTVNDHAKGMGGGAAALALLNGTSPRPRRLSAVHHPPPSRRRTRRLCPAGSTSRECTAPEFLVDDYVLGLFAHRRNRTFAECGANDGVNSHTRPSRRRRLARDVIEASPANFAVLRSAARLHNVHAVLWSEGQLHVPLLSSRPSVLATRPRVDEAKSRVDAAGGAESEQCAHRLDRGGAPRPSSSLHLDWFVLDVEGAGGARPLPWTPCGPACGRSRRTNWIGAS